MRLNRIDTNASWLNRRLELGLTNGFATEFGVHHTYTGGIQCLERNVSLENRALIAEVWEWTLSTLFKRLETLPQAS
ncbi:MAG: XRE family transcriptional regulator [bacterium]